MWHLLTHTAGLTYGFHYAHPGRRPVPGRRLRVGHPARPGPGRLLRPVGRLPLLFEPGTEFNYSVATDVLGRLVEVISGQSLDEFFRTRIFEPLGMTDTASGPRAGGAGERLAAAYMAQPRGPARSRRCRSTEAPPATRRRCGPAGAGWWGRPGTTTASP